MNIIKDFIAKLIGPSIIGQVVRGLVKGISGYLLGLGLDGQLVGNFASASEQMIVALVMMLVAQGASAVATKSALDTAPGEVPEVPKMLQVKK